MIDVQHTARHSSATPRRRASRLGATLALLLALTLPAIMTPQPAGAVTAIYFPQTGHALGYHFKTYWEQRGGLRSFGYPLSEEFMEDGRPTQYFERAVLHYFSEYAGTPYEVQPAQLGRDLLAGRENDTPVRPVPPVASTPERRFFPETGHTLRGAFLRAWNAGGALAVYGYPLTEEFAEVSPSDGQTYTVQYFERARFEYHPEYAGTRDDVLLGLLGTQRATARGLLVTAPFLAQPAPPATARTIARGDPARRVVALTFDAGADRGYGATILDTLNDKEIKASFGLTGQWARANPDLVRRIGAEGHHVINHTDNHRSFTGLSDRQGGLSPDDRVAQLDRADAAIAPLIGRGTRPWFRPPYGDYDAAALEQLAASGYSYNVMWTLDTLGWTGLATNAVTSRVLNNTVAGAIVLLHVGAASTDAAALPAIIDGLRAQGYGFVTVEELVDP